MAQTQRPGDGETGQARGADPNGVTRPTTAPPEAEDGTTVLPGGSAVTIPGRGTAGALSTLGDGRYRLTGQLGRGGMAEVFAAQDVRLGRTVAVKLLRPELAQDEVARQRFTREAHSVAALNHHAIVAVYDTGEEFAGGESTPYIVMELVEGRTVRELLLDEEAPPVDQALIIIAGVLEALSYSHRHGIVHRDIKPANVIITSGGAVKVMDFGIARALTGAAATMTQTGMVMGTPQYLSPEQALGKPVDHRSDLYAAGCMLYELLTLRPPFTGDTPLSVVYQHVQDAPVPPSHANHRVPPVLDPLVLRALAKSPDGRFQSADEFRAHLQHQLREMHGAAGAGYAAGAAVAAAAAAGLAAAGSGAPGPHAGTPRDGTAFTARLGAAGPAATPAAPTAALRRPYGGGPGHGAAWSEDEEPEPRRSGAWAWLGGVLALVAAAAVGVVLVISHQNHTTNSTTPPGAAVSATSQPSPTDTDTATDSPGRQPTSTWTSSRYTETPSPSPSPSDTATSSPSASASPSPSSSPSHSPSGSASSSQSSSTSPSPSSTSASVTLPPTH